MEHNQNKINHQRAIRIKFRDRDSGPDFFVIAEKTGRGREVILAVGEAVQWPLPL